MSKIRSGHYKSRNLPENYQVNDQVKSKPTFMLVVMLGIGLVLTFQDKYFLMGIIFFGFSGYHLLFRKNVNMVEFSDEFAVFYENESHEDCCVIYYNEIKDYSIKEKKFDTDSLTVQLLNGKTIVLKLLDRKRVEKNFEKRVK